MRWYHGTPSSAAGGGVLFSGGAIVERIWTVEIGRHVGERVRLAGWLHRFRRLSNVGFLVMRDARGLAQVVVDDAALADRLERLHQESVLVVEGMSVAQPQAPGGVEVHGPSVDVLSPAVAPLPFDLFRPRLGAQLPTLLDHASLALRHPRQRATFRLAAALVAGFRATLRGMDFVEVHTPKIVAAATEGGANVFAVDYFGRPAYLAQSPQFYKQILVGVFERVFEVGPVFRAEPHDTPRHLNQYLSLDAELGFVADHTTVMETLTRVLTGMLSAAREEAADPLALLGVELPEVPAAIPVVGFAEALEMIAAATGEDGGASRTWRRPTSAGSGNGRGGSTAPTFSSSSATRWPSGPSTPTPTRRGRPPRTASTSSSGVLSWSPAGSACTATRTTWRPSPLAGSIRSRWPGTWRRSGTGCRPTAASRSVWSGWSPG